MTEVCRHLGMRIEEVLRWDYISFKGLFESCERSKAGEYLDKIEAQIAIASAGAGGKEAADELENRLALYRSIRGYGEETQGSDGSGLEALSRDFGRGL